MTQHITLGGLSLVNLKRKPFRTAALTIVVAMLTVAFYGGSLLSMNLEAGLNSMQERMGADLMVTPQNTKNEAEALLTNGSASTFYFTNEITDEVAHDGTAVLMVTHDPDALTYVNRIYRMDRGVLAEA